MRIGEARAALYDYRVPPGIALRAYLKARRKRTAPLSATECFELHCASACRTAAEENAALEMWENDGGAQCR